jgi:hypothetical protein
VPVAAAVKVTCPETVATVRGIPVRRIVRTSFTVSRV